jgi:hypothetical protein
MSSPTADAASSPSVARPARKRLRLAVGAGIVVLAIGGLLVLLLRGGGPPTAGPLASPEHSSIGFPQKAGNAFPFGLAVAFDRSGRPARLESIAPVAPTPGLRLLDTRVAGAARGGTLVGSYRWPDPAFKDLHPVRGYVVPPAGSPAGRAGVQLILVLRADRPGRYVVKGVSVDYRVGTTSHRAVIHQGMAVCVVPADQKLPDGGCRQPDV